MNAGCDAQPTGPGEERSDRSLLLRVRAGSEDAATQLYLRYARRLLRLANYQTAHSMRVRFDPDDVVQSVFRTFFRRAAEGWYEVPPGEELWQLLLVIALNKIRRLAAYHQAEKRDVRATVASDRLDQLARTGDRPDGQSLQILEMVIADAVGQLPETQRQIVEMRIEGHAVAEIAGRVNVSKRSVERVLQKFRNELSRIINEPDNTS